MTFATCSASLVGILFLTPEPPWYSERRPWVAIIADVSKATNNVHPWKANLALPLVTTIGDFV